VLAKISVTVTEAKATLGTVKSVVEGSDFIVNWTGPQNYFDKIAILENKDTKKIYKYQRPRNKKPIKLTVPEVSGKYDVVYLTEQGRVLAKTTISVTEAKATLKTNKSVVVGSLLVVNWTGPQNYFDKIAIMHNKQSNKIFHYRRPINNKPVKLNVPTEIGSYSVVYLTEKGRVLAKTSIIVIAK